MRVTKRRRPLGRRESERAADEADEDYSLALAGIRPPAAKLVGRRGETRCFLCRRHRKGRFITHHITYQPERTVLICEFCHWVIHRPQDVEALIKRIKQRYVDHFGALPIKPD